MSMLYGHRFNNTHSIGAIVSAAGPTDLTDIDWLNYAAIIDQLDNIQKMVGAGYIFGQALDTRFAAASPIKGIRNIPTLMIHGNNDLVVAYSQSQRMEAAMNNASFPNKLVTINGANHDLNFGNPATAHLIIEEISGWETLYGR